MGIVADFADFVFGSAILNIISCSFLMLLAIEAGLIVGPEVSPCFSGGGSIVGAILTKRDKAIKESKGASNGSSM